MGTPAQNFINGANIDVARNRALQDEQRKQNLELNWGVLNNPDAQPEQKQAAWQNINQQYPTHEHAIQFLADALHIRGKHQTGQPTQKAPSAAGPAASPAPVATGSGGTESAGPQNVQSPVEAIQGAAPQIPQVSNPQLAQVLQMGQQKLAGGITPQAIQSYKSQAEINNDLALRTQQAIEDRMLEAARIRGQYGLQTAMLRTQAMQSHANPSGALSLESAKHLADQGQTFVNMQDGQPINFDEVMDGMPHGKLVPYVRGSAIVGWGVADQNARQGVWDNQVHAWYPLDLDHQGNVLGIRNTGSTHSNVSTDQYGNTTTSQASTTPNTPNQPQAPQAAPLQNPSAVPPPPAGEPPNPTLKVRPVSANTPQGVNVGARQPGTKPQGGAVKSRPISAQTPQGPPTAIKSLDANGNIPESAGGNPQVRQFANDLINDRDTDKIPAKARASAEALAAQYGWSQGAFTPREQKQMLVSKNFLDQLRQSPALGVLDSLGDRLLIEKAMDPSTGLVKQAVLTHLPARDAEFIRLFNAAAGSIQGLSSVTRQGRATMGIINALKSELPNILQSSSSKDAQARIDQLLKEVTLAQQKNSTLRMEGSQQWKPPADAPPAPKEDNKVLKDTTTGQVIAKSQGGNWVQP